MKILLLTDCPSPYQVEVFDEIARNRELQLQVAYLRRTDPSRGWSPAALSHNAIMLDGASGALANVREFVKKADLVIFNYYRHPHAERLLVDRAKLNRPWCFWGERPGFRKPEWIGRIVRSWKLRWLHSSGAPIWGVGQFAINRYKTEFGSGHEYFNYPYFSNLKRFSVDVCDTGSVSTSERTFLFSGSLTHRKGIDLLARAFSRLLREGHGARLKILGGGQLRRSLENILDAFRESVEFVGFVDWKDLPEQYAGSHVMCVPSRYDGWGLVVPEGLASGLPVIATEQMGSAVEFIKHGQNGWLIQAGDEEAILKAMREAVSLPAEQLAGLARSAQESIREHSLENGAARFKLYCSQTLAAWHY